MAANEIHIGDIGTIFEVTLLDDTAIVDISNATDLVIVFQKPDKTIINNTAVLSSDGTDGKMQYVVALDTELDQKGNWKIQGIVELPTGKWSSDIDKFKVYENLQ
jgi:glycerol-3-phosphate dehydrogenase